MSESEKFKNHLEKFSPHIQDVKLIGNTIKVHKDNVNHLINFKLMGAGFRKYLYILLAVLNNKQYIFIDEIENGLHIYDVELLLGLILDSMPQIQFFITTHSQEILLKLYKLLEQKEAVASFFNVYEDKHGNTAIQQYSQDDFIFNMKNKNEMRG